MNSLRVRCARTESRGFSLIELVIVVVIIGVIAAIAIPRMTSGARGAEEASLKKSLRSLRDAIEMYAGEHRGALPGSTADGKGNAGNTAASFENHLVGYSNEAGAVVDVRDADHRFGPYLRKIPPVPVGKNKGSRTVAIDTVNSPPLVTTGTEGWVYNPSTGQIIANSDDPNAAGTRSYDEY
jgi:prepilin-type N-terminal cleavage/methylation domain-containing protein